MVAILIVGLVVGFALGWGVYWYLQQQDTSRWTVPHFIREQSLSREIRKRVGREERPLVGGELFERTRTMLEHDAEVAKETAEKEFDDEPAETAPALTTPVTPEEDVSSEADGVSDVAPSTVNEAIPESDKGSVLAYCLTCQMRRQIQDAQRTETRTGRVAVRGKCPECGSELFTFVSGNR